MEAKKPRTQRKKTPKHTVIGRACRFPLEPSAPVCAELLCINYLCREARNLPVEESRERDMVTACGGARVVTAGTDFGTRTAASTTAVIEVRVG